MHPQGYKYTYAKVMHKRLVYMVELKIFKTDVTATPRRYSFTEEEEQEVWKWEKKKLGVLKVHLMSLSVMFGESQSISTFYVNAQFLSAKPLFNYLLNTICLLLF